MVTKTLVSKFPVVMEPMMKHCWVSLFIGTPCICQITPMKNDFYIFASLTLTSDLNVAGDKETHKEHVGLFLQ